MDDRKWERWAALGGIVFVVLNLIGVFLPGQPPSGSDSPAKVVKFFHDHAGGIKAGGPLLGIGLVGLLWWFGSLSRMMRRAEDGDPRLTTVASVSLAIAGSLALISATVMSVAALRIDDIGEAAKFFAILSNTLFAAAGFAILSHIAAVAALNYRRPFMAPWLTYAGWVSAACFLVASFGTATDASGIVAFGLLAFITWCVFIIGISIEMWRGSPESPAA